MPREGQSKPLRKEVEEPPWLELGAGQAVHVPAAAETTYVAERAGDLLTEERQQRRRGGSERDAHLLQPRFQASRVLLKRRQRCAEAMRRR